MIGLFIFLTTIFFMVGVLVGVIKPTQIAKIFKDVNYNGNEMFEDGYSKAENEINKGKNPTLLFNQCPMANDDWDRGWIKACSDYRKIHSKNK